MSACLTMNTQRWMDGCSVARRRQPRRSKSMGTLVRGATLALLVLTGASRASSEEPSASGSVDFRIDDAFGRDSVGFRTEAPLEDIVGTTNKVKGDLHVNLRHVAGPETSVRVELPVGSFKTGISLRDIAVGRALGSGDHPVAVFTLRKVLTATAEELKPNERVHLKAIGTLEFNGVGKDIPVQSDAAGQLREAGSAF